MSEGDHTFFSRVSLCLIFYFLLEQIAPDAAAPGAFIRLWFCFIAH